MAETNSLCRMRVCSVQFHLDVNTAWNNYWISIKSFTFVTTFISTKATLYSIGIISCLDGSKTRCYCVCNRRLVSVHCLYHTCYCVHHGVVWFGFHSRTIISLCIIHLQQMCYVPNKKSNYCGDLSMFICVIVLLLCDMDLWCYPIWKPVVACSPLTQNHDITNISMSIDTLIACVIPFF